MVPEDPLQDTAMPISQAGVTFGKTFNAGQNITWQYGELGKKWARNSPANTKVREEGKEGSSLGVRSGIPLQPVEETMVEDRFPSSLWRGPHWRRYPESSQWRPPIVLPVLSVLRKISIKFSSLYILTQLEVSVFWGSLNTCTDSVHWNHDCNSYAFWISIRQCLLPPDDESVWQLRPQISYTKLLLAELCRTAILGRPLLNPLWAESSRNLAAKLTINWGCMDCNLANAHNITPHGSIFKLMANRFKHSLHCQN